MSVPNHSPQNSCWCGRTREQHQKTRWQQEWGERHDFHNQRVALPTHLMPMLAVNTAIDTSKTWVFERKYDGMRCICSIGSDWTTLFSRQGIIMNQQFPELTDLHTVLPEGVYDGEIVTFDGAGLDSLQLLQERMGQHDEDLIAELQKTRPVHLVLFDLLELGEASFTNGEMLLDRRIALQAVLADVPESYDMISLSEMLHLSLEDASSFAREYGWEGIVAKISTSAYEPGKRRATWKKWKISKTQDCVVVGLTEPKGLRKGFGALEVAAYNEQGELVDIGNVGSGFTEEEIEEALTAYKNGRLVVEVEYRSWSKTGKLIEPRFKAFRRDKTVEECEIGH